MIYERTVGDGIVAH